MKFSDTGLPQDERLEKAFDRFIAVYGDDGDAFIQGTLERLRLAVAHTSKPPLATFCAALIFMADPDVIRGLPGKMNLEDVSAEFGDDVRNEVGYFLDDDADRSVKASSEGFKLLKLADATVTAREKIEFLSSVQLLGYSAERDYLAHAWAISILSSGTNDSLEKQFTDTLTRLGKIINFKDKQAQAAFAALPKNRM